MWERYRREASVAAIIMSKSKKCICASYLFLWSRTRTRTSRLYNNPCLSRLPDGDACAVPTSHDKQLTAWYINNEQRSQSHHFRHALPSNGLKGNCSASTASHTSNHATKVRLTDPFLFQDTLLTSMLQNIRRPIISPIASFASAREIDITCVFSRVHELHTAHVPDGSVNIPDPRRKASDI